MPPKAPKTILDKVVVAIRALKDARGSSRQAIAKYLKQELDTDNATALKLAFKKGVASGQLAQAGQSFTVVGDTAYEAPEGERLGITDETVGMGAEAEAGDEVTVAYVGTLDSSGARFDSASSFTFTLGAGEVIKGWDQGVAGMRVGGKRSLVVPPKLGYGQKGSAPDIPPNATLRFSVTLKSIK